MVESDFFVPFSVHNAQHILSAVPYDDHNRIRWQNTTNDTIIFSHDPSAILHGLNVMLVIKCDTGKISVVNVMNNYEWNVPQINLVKSSKTVSGWVHSRPQWSVKLWKSLTANIQTKKKNQIVTSTIKRLITTKKKTANGCHITFILV